jgi:hypothetical protein
MTSVSALPFAVGMAGALLLFAAWLPLAIRESRRPYHWREPAPVPAPSRQRFAPTLHVVDPPRAADAQSTPPSDAREHRRPLTRVAIVAAAFTVWSLWSLRPRSGHR